jgi:hypothetical protein
MEHISSILPHAMGALARGAVTGPTSPGAEKHRSRPATLQGLTDRFAREEELENPDVLSPLADLRLTPEDALEVPGFGTFGFTDWSRRQCASLLGLRWDRWFENASAAERALELNRRFARGQGKVKLRTRRLVPGDASLADGTLTAMVSPGYQAMPDSQMAGLLKAALGHDQDPKLLRADITDRTTSYVIASGEPYKIGGPGNVGDVWGGILVRNSGVGFASLLVMAHLTRLLCKNGMTAPLPDPVILRRRHRATDGGTLLGLLVERLAGLSERLGRGVEALRSAAGRMLARPVGLEVKELLQRAGLPLRLLPDILDAYEQEPEPTAFGVSQAVTLAAQSRSPEERVELEQMAGRYLTMN